MRVIFLRVFALLCCLAATAAAQTTAPDPEPLDVTGVVRSAQTRENLPSVFVTLEGSAANGRTSLSARSDLNGRFRFSAVLPGDHVLYLQKSGYERDQRLRQIVRISPDESRLSLSFEMRRSPAISGRVLNSEGDPVPQARVLALAYVLDDGVIRPAEQGSAETDDRGDYRLHGLRPGKFFLLVTAVSPGWGRRQRGPAVEDYVPTYFPGAATLSEGTPVRLNWGDEQAAIDVRLLAAPPNRISGMVIDGSGAPCGDCSVTATLVADGLPRAQVRARGGPYQISGLPAGEYRLQAVDQRRGAQSESLALGISERANLQANLVVGAGSSIRGRLVIEAPPDISNDKPYELQSAMVMFMANESSSRGRPPAARIDKDDLSFEVSGVAPGDYLAGLRLQPQLGYLKEMRLGGQSLGSRLLRVPADATLGDLEIHVGFGTAAVSGVVRPTREAKTAVVAQASVLLLPADDRPGYLLPQVAQTNTAGEFSFPAAPPGDYLVFALDPTGGPQVWETEMRRRYQSYSERLKLKPGDEINLEMVITPDAR